MLRKTVLVTILIILVTRVTIAQSDTSYVKPKHFGVATGLGVSLISAPSIVDYLNSLSQSQGRVDDFTSAAEFYGTAEFIVRDPWSVKLEYAYILKSYNVGDGTFSNYTYSYGVHMPSVLIHRFFTDHSSVFKVGGGVGYHIARFSEEYSFGKKNYRSTGGGIKLEAEMNTSFGDNLYSYIVTEIRKSFMSSLKDANGSELVMVNDGTMRSVSMPQPR
ncbi:MAG: hypothetical protein HY707_11545, partial [Ignavibacteriae bacterium]|nr:hypothetical protein [Ignavibacteriota bacterium]